MTTDRPSYVANLRALADLIETHPDVPLPYQCDDLRFYLYTAGEALALHSLMVGPVVKRERDGDFPVRVNGRLVGFTTEVAIHQRGALAASVPEFPPLVPALAALIDETFRDEPAAVSS